MAKRTIASKGSGTRTDLQSLIIRTADILHLIGESSFNPAGSNNNCVSLTFAKIMLCPNVDIFWHNVLGYTWGNRRGMTEDELESVLRTSKWQFQRTVYVPSAGRTAFENYRDDYARRVTTAMGARQVATYHRKDGTGHCVEAGATAFMCYQHSTDAINVTQELEEAVQITIYALTHPTTIQQTLEWHDRARWETIHRRKDPHRLLKILSPHRPAFVLMDPSWDDFLAELGDVERQTAHINQELAESVPCPSSMPAEAPEPECRIFLRGVS